MKSTIFREYDIRGIVNDELIISEVYNLARAIALYLVELKPLVKTIAVGMDGREHSAQLKEQLCRGLLDSGLNVIFIGVCTSPMTYFATHTMPIDGAIMITASHNPKEYNGFKIMLGTQSLWGQQIRDIGELYAKKKHLTPEQKGEYQEQSITDNYVAWHVEKFNHLQGMDLPVVIDCGNGCAGVVIPTMVEQMKWHNVQVLYEKVDGTFPNHEADPTKEKNMVALKAAVEETDGAIGIGFDGDADRMGAMTHEGVLVPGDKLLAIFAEPMVKANPGMTVVYNVVCSAGLGELLQKWGANAIVTPVGHSIIEESMHEHHALLGGETSCHFFFKDRHFGYDDGIYAMFRLLEIIVQSHKTLTQLLSVFPHKVTSPEYRVPCPEETKYVIVNEIKSLFYQQKQWQVLAIDGVRVTMDYGWGIVRASNTQPVLSIRFEANSEQDLRKVKQDFITVLRNYFDEDYLRAELQM
jgi:phosphomannomutase / phosphoglucomutase